MLNQTTLKSRATLLGKVFKSKGVTLTRAEQLDLVAQLEGARDWHHVSAEVAKSTTGAVYLDVEALRDKRMSELNPEQTQDAKELWIRGQIEWFPDSSRSYVEFLLQRIDELRKAAQKQTTSIQDQPLDALQREAAQWYCQGDFSHVTNYNELKDLGDTLFQFVLYEIHDAEGDRDEAVRMMRAAADQLTEVADLMEDERGLELQRKKAQEQPPKTKRKLHMCPFPGLDAVDSAGKYAGWRLRFLSDRFGEPQEDLEENHPDLYSLVETPIYERLRAICVKGMGFISENNGALGVLFEFEVRTQESDSEVQELLPEADAKLRLQDVIKLLAQSYPNVHFAVGGPGSVYDGRLGVWAFTDAEDLLTFDEAHQLTSDMVTVTSSIVPNH